MTQKWWRIPETGSALGVRILAMACRLLGRRVARGMLLFVAAYYVAFKPLVRRVSRAYLERAGQPTSLSAVYRHVLRFAQCSLDRFFFLSGRVEGFNIGIHGFELLLEQRALGRGAILLGGHLGSFDALRALARAKDGVEVYAGVYFDNAQQVTQELERAGARARERMIPIRPGSIDHVLRIRELVDQGQFVALLADRWLAEEGPSSGSSGQEKAVALDFLGAKASFPLGPYAIAAALGCPIYFIAGLHFPPNQYDLYCELLVDRVPPRRENPGALRDCAQRFAERLEHYSRIAPDNWFNFYDFWNRPESG